MGPSDKHRGDTGSVLPPTQRTAHSHPSRRVEADPAQPVVTPFRIVAHAGVELAVLRGQHLEARWENDGAVLRRGLDRSVRGTSNNDTLSMRWTTSIAVPAARSGRVAVVIDDCLSPRPVERPCAQAVHPRRSNVRRCQRRAHRVPRRPCPCDRLARRFDALSSSVDADGAARYIALAPGDPGAAYRARAAV
jgi:hypothetical protein